MRSVLRWPRLALAAAACAGILLASCGGAAFISPPGAASQGSAKDAAGANARGVAAPAPAVPQAAVGVARSGAVAQAPGAQPAQGTGGPAVTLPTIASGPQMLIKNATVRIEAKDPTAGLDRLGQIATDMQGQLTNSQ